MSSTDDATRDAAYARRLSDLQGARWKRALSVQRPYRWNLRRLHLGRTLDVGCGIGRNLVNLDGDGVGVDHNSDAVAMCRARGLVAYTSEEFPGSDDGTIGGFSSLLLAHVLEHMSSAEAVGLLRSYLPHVRRPGKVVLITPQERGHASDPTHAEFMDAEVLTGIATDCGLAVERSYSFPFPRRFGRLFTYNEFVVVATAT
jgi:SAM-dependent methyltransferase